MRTFGCMLGSTVLGCMPGVMARFRRLGVQETRLPGAQLPCPETGGERLYIRLRNSLGLTP